MTCTHGTATDPSIDLSEPSDGDPAHLLDALVGLCSDLDLARVLQRVVRSARDLTGARYGALGRLGPDGTLAGFVTEGLTPEEAASTLPPEHPEMTSCLAVPVHVRERAFGTLYLTDKVSAAEFSHGDERTVAALATAAGVAIHNAGLYSCAQQREHWLAASADVTRMLLDRTDRDRALGMVAQRARELTDGTGACVLLADEPEKLVIAGVDGAAIDGLVGQSISRHVAPIQPVLDQGAARFVADCRSLLNGSAEPTPLPALAVPFRSSTDPVGLLLVTEPRPVPSSDDQEMLQAFADRAAIALDLARARDHQQAMALLEERDRIARDLHDVVIQRLFATGLMLQRTHRLIEGSEARSRLETAIEELDATTRSIRSAIFELYESGTGIPLRAEIGELTRECGKFLGFVPYLEMRGPINTVVDHAIRPQLLAVVREALTNVAKHAEATRVDIRLTVAHQELTVRISDDGIGIDDAAAESGLRNLRDRARLLGGTVAIVRADPQGTAIEWRVPLT